MAVRKPARVRLPIADKHRAAVAMFIAANWPGTPFAVRDGVFEASQKMVDLVEAFVKGRESMEPMERGGE
jgi:hypothetical protein